MSSKYARWRDASPNGSAISVVELPGASHGYVVGSVSSTRTPPPNAARSACSLVWAAWMAISDSASRLIWGINSIAGPVM